MMAYASSIPVFFFWKQKNNSSAWALLLTKQHTWQLLASFLIFLTLGSIKQSNTHTHTHVSWFNEYFKIEN